MDKPCKKCEGKGGRQTKPFWITAWIPCEACKGTGVVQKKIKTSKTAKVVKYDVSAIGLARQKEPHFLASSGDGKLIMRRDFEGNFKLLANNQETVVDMSAADAKDFALWILLSRGGRKG